MFVKFPQTLRVTPALILNVAPALIVISRTLELTVTQGCLKLETGFTVASTPQVGAEPQSPQHVLQEKSVSAATVPPLHFNFSPKIINQKEEWILQKEEKNSQISLIKLKFTRNKKNGTVHLIAIKEL